MWFKHLQMFRLLEPFNDDAETLQEKLFAAAARPCGKTEPSTLGWMSPFGKNSEVLVHSCNGFLLFSACREERVLPTSVIREYLDEKIKTIEEEQDRKVYSKEKARLRDEVTFTLLPKAFTKQEQTFVYIDPTLNLLLVDTASRNKAEEITVLLRESLGSLKLSPLETKSTPSTMMTQWLLSHQYPGSLVIEDFCEMVDPKTGEGKIRAQKQDLTSKEIGAHLKSGKHVTQLSLSWKDKLNFVFCDDMTVKRIHCLDLLKTQLKDADVETKEQRIDADFFLMSAEYSQFLHDLFHAFDGLVALTDAKQLAGKKEEEAVA